jgi:hypothetical protein
MRCIAEQMRSEIFKRSGGEETVTLGVPCCQPSHWLASGGSSCAITAGKSVPRTIVALGGNTIFRGNCENHCVGLVF